MLNVLPRTIENLYSQEFPSDSWLTYISQNGIEVFLYLRRDSAGGCSWGLYHNVGGIRTPFRISATHSTPDLADLEWFQAQITLDLPKST